MLCDPYFQLVMQDDMNAMRSLENSRNISHWKYIEDYLEEREFSFYPVHITPGYELAIKHTDFVSDVKYRKDYKDSQKKPNAFRVNDTEFYKSSKDLESFLSVHKYREQYMKDKAKGYKGCKGLDMVQETLHDAQARLSNWKYRSAAEATMNKFHLDIEVPTFKLAKENQLQQSESKYRADGKLTNTKYTSAGKDEFALKMHNDNKKNMNPTLYTAEYEKTQHTYTFKPDQMSVKLARDVAKMQSDREYRKNYAEDVKTASAFKNIDMWPEDRFHSEVSKQQSDHVYKEDYLIDRECCFYPVHITPGYELALEVNRFQSEWLYKQKYNKENKGKPNAFKQSETEYYNQSKKLNDYQNDQKYRDSGKKQNEKWQFTIITPVNEHAKLMKELNHPTKYTNEAKAIQMKYDLPLQRVDLQAHREAKKIVSNYVYLQKYRDEQGKSHLWNAVEALEGQRHKDNALNTSEKLYKEAAGKMSSKINLPVDMLSLKSAKEAAAACSNLDYKKTYEEAIKQCRAFTKLASTDIKEYEHHNYVQRILSDKHYKEEWYDQQGWCIPEFDTPELRRLKEQYDRGDVSDVVYKKNYNKKVKGRGLTVFDGPEFQHAKEMKKEQSKIAYEADGKDKHKWASWMANQTPGAVELKEAQKYASDNNYIDRSEYQGRGAACITDEIDARLEAQKMQSTNEYKKDYEETKHVSKFVTVTDAIDAVGFKEAQKMQSDNLYKKKHLEEDIGKPAELAMSIKLNEDRVHQQLASELPYKSKGEKQKHIQSYQNNLFLTPWAKYVEEMKDLMSDVKYKQEWEDEKSCIWVPYWWTCEYEHFKAQTDEKNMKKYTEKANKERSRVNIMTTEAPSIAYVKEAGALASNVNYGDIKGCVQSFQVPKFVVDSPAMVSQREAQQLVSENEYKKAAEAGKKNIANDPTGFTFMADQYRKEAIEAGKDVNVAKLDQSYNVPMTNTELANDLKTKEYVESQKLASENKYRREAMAEMHSVNGCAVVDTPLNETHNAAQELASDLKYKEDISKRKVLYDGMEDVKAAAHKQEILSNLKYHEEYENFWKGAVLSLPVPFDLNMESMCDRQKVRDDKEYRKDAKEAQQSYIVVADTPRMRELKQLCELASERVYKTDAIAEMKRVNNKVVDSFTNMEVKRIEALKNDRAYKAEAMAEMSLNAQIPTKDIEHQLASTKVADKIEYRKDGKLAMTQNLQAVDGQELQHAKAVKDLTNERAYKAEAQAEMHAVNCNVISADMKNKQEVQKLTDETSYKKEALTEMQQVNMNITDSYAMNNAKQIMENVSDVHYKSCDQFGGVADNEWCFQLPADKHVRAAVDINKLQSDAEYKKAFNAQKGKVAFIPADTPEFSRLKKMQEQYSDLEYREAAKKGMKDITFTPSMKEATKAAEIASDVKYRKDGREYVKKNTQAKDIVTAHQSNITQDTLLSARKYKEQFLEEAGQATALELKDDLLMTTLDKSQKNASKAAYVQKADTADFTKLEKTYDHDRHQDNLQVVSDARYKQKLDGKSLDMVPEIEAKLEFQNLASKLPYTRDAGQNENKFDAKNTQMYKQLHDLKAVQSEVQYKKKARQGMDKHKAEGLENRVDIDHSANVTKLCSENEYKRNKQQSGFTFVPEAPLHDHHRHAGQINSELAYKRAGLESQRGKGVQLDESNPFQQNFSDAQRFTSGRNYKTAAKELMSRGAACVEDDPNMERVRKAGRILSDREYRKDFEKGVKGYGYDLRSTPQMQAIKNAEKVKSDKNYKKQYEESMKGKGAFTMESPQMKAAMAAQALMRGEKLGGIGEVPDAIAANDKWVAARVSAILDTPEMRRIKEAKKNGMSNYRDVDYSKGAKVVLDTPEMQRIKNASKIQSKVGYSDNKVRGRSCGVLDTPEMRMVKRNQKNFSNLDYKKDLMQERGRAIQVVDDLNTRRAKKATEIASDLAYKGIRGKVDEMEAARNILENQAKQERIRSQAPQQAKGFKVGRGMQRYNADPGSIFELDDPTDIEAGTHGKSLRRPSSRLSEGSLQDQDDSDYELLANWDPKKLQEQCTGNWQNYLTGSYRKAYTPGHVMKYQESDSKQALEHVGYESSFYGSNVATPAPQYQQEEEVEEVSITFKALYDYTAADDDEISFMEGDIIVQAQPVGGGWYFGVVESSGASGMLPGNYVEQLN